MPDYKVSAKVNGKWVTFGKIKTNQYGNLQLSFPVNDDLQKLFTSGDKWVNFSLFPVEEKPVEVKPETQELLDNLKRSVSETDEIPF